MLSYPDFEGSGLWWNAVRHKISMTNPDTHSRGQTVEIDGSAHTVENKRIVCYVKTDNRKRVSVTDGCKASVLSVKLQNSADRDIVLWWTGVAVWISEKIVHNIPLGFDIDSILGKQEKCSRYLKNFLFKKAKPFFIQCSFSMNITSNSL